MKIRIVLMAVFCLLLGTAAISAQEKTTNFAGNWELDTTRSKLSERMRIESMTMNVTQTEKELTVESKTVRPPRPEGGGEGRGGGGMGGGMGRGGGMMGGGGDATLTYGLDGKETSLTSPDGMGDTKLKAKVEKDGKMKLTQTRSFETQMGAISIKIVETWELLDEGKTLKVMRDMETPRGTQSSEMIFAKKP